MALPNLTDEFIADSYRGILHTSNVPLTGSTPVPVYDGLGNTSVMSIGTDGVSINGNLSATCIVVGGVSICGALSSAVIDAEGDINLIAMVNHVYPVGSIFFSADNVNPSVRFTSTTWTLVSEGKFIAGVGGGVDKNSVSVALSAGDDTTIGEYSHGLSVSELPAHTHRPLMRYMSVTDDNSRGAANMGASRRHLEDKNVFGNEISPPTLEIETVGGNQRHNNIPPYFGLYVWKRTS